MLSLMNRIQPTMRSIACELKQRFVTAPYLFATALICYLLLILSGCGSEDGTSTAGLSGRGGSLARFAVTPSHLYAVDNDNLNVYQFVENGSISQVNSIALGPGVETIATLDTRLYIGTNQAMLIYDISSPANPIHLSQFGHFLGCDPVVVQDTLAFITLRTTGCRPSTVNTLDIVNIKMPDQPTLVATYGLQSPYGLGIDGDLLFVCEGENGLKIFDVSNPYNLIVVKDYRDVDAYDVIPNRGILVLTGKHGIVQYDYSDHNNIRQLSSIEIP
jgi:hypothetical protein